MPRAQVEWLEYRRFKKRATIIFHFRGVPWKMQKARASHGTYRQCRDGDALFWTLFLGL